MESNEQLYIIIGSIGFILFYILSLCYYFSNRISIRICNNVNDDDIIIERKLIEKRFNDYGNII